MRPRLKLLHTGSLGFHPPQGWWEGKPAALEGLGRSQPHLVHKFQVCVQAVELGNSGRRC